jgi:hypothetical protein
MDTTSIDSIICRECDRMRQNHRRGQALVRRTSVRSFRWCRRSTSFVLLTRAARYAGRLSSGWIFFTSIGKRLKYHRKGQRASSPSSLIGLPDHSGIFPLRGRTARLHAIRKAGGQDALPIVGSYLHANYRVSLIHVPSVGARIRLVCVECAPDHVVTASTSKAQPRAVSFYPTLPNLPSSAGTVSEEHRGLCSHRRPKP